ncbi:MAG: hypothetical protein HC805_04510 [Alkalinema sp. RL_2_19]|nr:hypothetical protein [Alkalinema sp. RL_2_19]
MKFSAPNMLTSDFKAQSRSDQQKLQPYLNDLAAVVITEDGIVAAHIPNWTPAMIANRDFFNHPAWAAQYFTNENASLNFQQRYRAAMRQWDSAGWDDQVVVDIGCGPGNV